MSRKSTLPMILLSVLVLSMMLATELAGSARANFYTPPPDMFSPTNSTYATNSIPLNVRIRHPAFFPQYNIAVFDVFFSLDGEENVSIPVTTMSGDDEFVTYRANATLSGLSDGFHTVEVFAKENPSQESYVVGSANFTIDTTSPPVPPTGLAFASASMLIIFAFILLFVTVRSEKRRALERQRFYSNPA